MHKSWSSTDCNFHILQYYMKRYVKMIVKMMKEEKLFASQGGPIILTQVWFHSKNFVSAKFYPQTNLEENSSYPLCDDSNYTCTFNNMTYLNSHVL